jgi:Tfp pilus assembly protein PilO
MEAAMKIKNRQEFLVVLTIAAFALLVGVNFILEPLGGWWSARQTQIKNLSDAVRDGRKLIAREASIRSRWSDMTANALPANTSLAEQKLLTAVDGWSRSSGAEVTSLMPQWKNESTNYLTLTCRVETSGNLGTLSRFLYDLERGPMALRLDSLELSARDKEGQQMTLSTEINGLALLIQPDKK